MTKGIHGGKQEKKAKHDQPKAIPETLNQLHHSDSQAKDRTEATEQPKSEIESAMQKLNWREKCWKWLDKRSPALQVIVPSVFSALILGAIIAQAVIYKKQANIMRDQSILLNTSIQQTIRTREIENRAWISVQSAGINSLKVGEPLSVITIFVNSGKTPAYKFVTGGRVEIRDVNDPVPDPMPIQLIRYNPGKGILSPSGTYHLTGAVDGLLDQETLRYINGGQKRVYVWGQIMYEDLFQRSRFLKFCLVNKARTTDFGPCSNNNEGD